MTFFAKTFPLFLVSSLCLTCGRIESDTPLGTGGASSSSTGGSVLSSGGQGASSGGAIETGGAASETGGTASGGGLGGLPSATDCPHPKVVEACQGDYCRIEPGCFIMGAPLDEFGRALVNSDPVQVTLTRAFWMARTEVTREQWNRAGLAQPELEWLDGERECLEPDCPQGNLTVYLGLQYANRLSEMEGLEPCYLVDEYDCAGSVSDGHTCPQIKINANSPYECKGYRLPMEAEWEYAARAGTTTAFPTGAITPQRDSGGCYFDPALDVIGWYCMNSPAQTQPVAQKPPNGWGLHDMHGNAWEPVNDLYGPSGYLTGPYVPSKGPLVDPTGAVNPPDDITRTAERRRRVARGGSHISIAVSANASRRFALSDHGSGSSLGLRIARTIFEHEE